MWVAGHKEETYVSGHLDRRKHWYFNWIEGQTAAGGGFWGYKFWTQQINVKWKPKTSLYLGVPKVWVYPCCERTQVKFAWRKRLDRNTNKQTNAWFKSLQE